MNETIIETIILILVVSGVFTFIFYHPVKRYFRRNSELKEDSSGQILKEPHPLRELTTEEKSKLSSMTKSANNFSPYYILGFILMLTFVLTINRGRAWDLAKDSYGILGLILLIPVLVTFSIIYQDRLRGKKMRQDLSASVYQVKGKVYREIHRARDSTEFNVTVRGIMFDGSQVVGSNSKLFELVNQDEYVSVEYSPNSKHVWKIQQISGMK